MIRRSGKLLFSVPLKINAIHLWLMAMSSKIFKGVI